MTISSKDISKQLLLEANKLVEQANSLLSLSRKINPLIERDIYLDDPYEDQEIFQKLKHQILMFIEFSGEVTAKQITERFDLARGYPSENDQSMIAHIILNELKQFDYVLRILRDKEYYWVATTKGTENAKFYNLVRNNPTWDEIEDIRFED